MKSVTNYYIRLVILVFCVSVGFQIAAAQKNLSAEDKQTLAGFENQVKEYVNMRERLENTLPKLPKDATPEQIDAHEAALLKLVQAERQNAARGEMFTPGAVRLIRNIVKAEFKGKKRYELRKTVLEADTKGVPLKINYPYPDSQELVEMPPKLLLNLPQLPKQLRYRFVGRNLLLVDRENQVIVDYMTNALP